MASSFPDSFDQLSGDSTRSFDDDGYFGYVSGGVFPADPAEFASEDGEGGFIGPEDGVAIKEWRRANLIRLAEKEKREKETLSQILGEAEEYKVEFYKKRSVSCEANKCTNREKEKLFVVSHEKFHAEADKTYWKAIAELIPKEVPAIEKRGKKEQDKDKAKPSITVMQGPKPGKPTDLSRMRHILLKLKHNAPPHLVPSTPSSHPPPSAAVGPKSGDSAASAVAVA